MTVAAGRPTTRRWPSRARGARRSQINRIAKRTFKDALPAALNASRQPGGQRDAWPRRPRTSRRPRRSTVLVEAATFVATQEVAAARPGHVSPTPVTQTVIDPTATPTPTESPRRPTTDRAPTSAPTDRRPPTADAPSRRPPRRHRRTPRPSRPRSRPRSRPSDPTRTEATDRDADDRADREPTSAAPAIRCPGRSDRRPRPPTARPATPTSAPARRPGRTTVARTTTLRPSRPAPCRAAGVQQAGRRGGRATGDEGDDQASPAGPRPAWPPPRLTVSPAETAATRVRHPFGVQPVRSGRVRPGTLSLLSGRDPRHRRSRLHPTSVRTIHRPARRHHWSVPATGHPRAGSTKENT